LGSGELLFQVAGDSLLLPSEGGSELARPFLVQGLACDSHDDDESLLLSVHNSGGGLSRSRNIILLPLGGSSDHRGRGSLLLVDREVEGAARHGQQDDGG
jgi:hypothetical protein